MDDHKDPHAGLEETVASQPEDFVGTGFKGKPQAYETRHQGPAGEILKSHPGLAASSDDGARQTERYNRTHDKGDMRHLGPYEAAMVIAPTMQADASSRMDPETAHGVSYIKEVCGHLGMEATPENIEHVRLTLREHHIALHAGNEYPKWVGEGGERVIVNSREEEDKFNGDREALIADKQNPMQATESNQLVDPAKAPVYEPFAGPREPGAPNRPTEPAPVASPVSDNRANVPQGNFPVADSNPNPTPNPQPGDFVSAGPNTFEADSVVPGKSSGQADPHVDGQQQDPAPQTKTLDNVASNRPAPAPPRRPS